MARPNQAEIETIDTAFQTLEIICERLGTDQLTELHAIRAKIFRHFREQGSEDPDIVLSSTALTVRQIHRGIRQKREIGDDNDTFHRSGFFPEAEAAYGFGQKLVRWNRLCELRWIDRLLARRGPMTAIPLDATLDAADIAFDAWVERED